MSFELMEVVPRDVAAVEVDTGNNEDPEVVEGLGAPQSACHRAGAAVRAQVSSTCRRAREGREGKGRETRGEGELE